LRESLNPTWDLEVLFPGGSQSPQLEAFLAQLEADIAALRPKVAEAKVPANLAEGRAWAGLVETVQEVTRRLRQAGAFVSCLNAQNVKDTRAKQLGARVSQISAAFSSVLNLLDDQLLKMDDDVFAAVLQEPNMEPIAYPLQERRTRAKDKLSPEMESLAGDLGVDGYHGWGDLYNIIVGRITIPVERDGQTTNLSVGQAFNRMSDGDRAVRQQVFVNWEKAWQGEAEVIGAALNHLAGYRINLYKTRGWDSVLQEPLEMNRMTEETLNVMWDVITANKHHLVAFMDRKAKLLGLDGLAWYDTDAPLSSEVTKVTYDEAADFIVDQFRVFSPRMADFAQMAFAKRWIEAEDRPGKRPGGFCTSFPVSGESRIFMTFGGTAGNVATLAHELGHAFHGHVMRDLPQLARNYAMNVAETASTFAEMLVSDAALKAAQTKEERLAMLNDKLRHSVGLLMNIHARFLFETRFYAERKKGLVSVDRLNELMLTAQKEAFCGALTEYHPTFWASKLHFYATGQPFYNFPYTFGFLFSSGVYARALAEGPGFEQKYADLLRDTGRMRVEDLAARHMGVDLKKPEFWQSAIDLTLADISEFLKLTE